MRDKDFTRVDEAIFATCRSDSVDYAVMEKTRDAVMVPLDAGWNDVGSWAALHDVLPADEQGNVMRGDVLLEDTDGCYVHADSRLVAALGSARHGDRRNRRRGAGGAQVQGAGREETRGAHQGRGPLRTRVARACRLQERETPSDSNLSAFKAYDVRGRIPDEINAELVYQVGRAYAAFVKPKRVCVGRDIRLTSEEFAQALIRGLTDAGVDVLDIGLCGTEGVYFATFHWQLDGGIMVTASHNPPDYNGLKLVREQSKPIGSDTGLKDIAAMIASGKLPPPAAVKGKVDEARDVGRSTSSTCWAT